MSQRHSSVRNASLELNFLQEIGTGNLVNTTEVNVERDGRFTTNTVQLSGKLIRNNTNVRIAGQNAEAHLNGFYMIDGNDLYDNHTLVDHLVPNCQSNEVYKGLLSGKATGVFNGKVHVHRRCAEDQRLSAEQEHSAERHRHHELQARAGDLCR
jgi:Fe-S cluster assembly scaffold protein SufB